MGKAKSSWGSARIMIVGTLSLMAAFYLVFLIIPIVYAFVGSFFNWSPMIGQMDFAGLVGAGRSELLNALFGLGGYVSGTVALHGQPIHMSSPQMAIENGLALITEDRKRNGFVGVLSVQDNIVMASYPRFSRHGWVEQKRVHGRACQLFDEMNIKAPSSETRVETLSGGNQQKVALAKWMYTDPKVLILDEPTRGIDVGAKFEVQNIIQDLASQGISVLMVSSELEELVRNCDRVIVLNEGRTVKELTGRDITEDNLLHSIAVH